MSGGNPLGIGLPGRQLTDKVYDYHIFHVEPHPDFVSRLQVRAPHLWLSPHLSLAGDYEPLAEPSRPNPIPAGGVVHMQAAIAGSRVTLSFPWAAPNGAAVFRRGDAVWVVFDAPAALDVSKAPRGLAQFSSVQAVRGADYSAIRLASPREIPILNIIGMTEQSPNPGYAVFQLAGKELRLYPIIEEPGAKELFYIFRDLTTGKETYPAGRFFYSALPQNGTVVLDFNKAYNPYCAYAAGYNCPIPPRENDLPVAIRAGEKNYGKAH